MDIKAKFCGDWKIFVNGIPRHNDYQVKLGDNTQLGYKISMMEKMIDQMDDYQSGILDLTFTTYPDRGGYKPFN